MPGARFASIRGANLPLLLQYGLISAAASAFRYTVQLLRGNVGIRCSSLSTDVSGLPVGPIIKGRVSKKKAKGLKGGISCFFSGFASSLSLHVLSPSSFLFSFFLFSRFLHVFFFYSLPIVPPVVDLAAGAVF